MSRWKQLNNTSLGASVGVAPASNATEVAPASNATEVAPAALSLFGAGCPEQDKNSTPALLFKPNFSSKAGSVEIRDFGFNRKFELPKHFPPEFLENIKNILRVMDHIPITDTNKTEVIKTLLKSWGAIKKSLGLSGEIFDPYQNEIITNIVMKLHDLQRLED